MLRRCRSLKSSFTAGAQVLALLPVGYTVVLKAVPAAHAAVIQSASHVTAFSVMDTATAIASMLDVFNAASHLTAITTDQRKFGCHRGAVRE